MSSVKTSASEAGRLVIRHERGDTLRRTITLKSGGVAINLVGSTIEVIVSQDQDGSPIATLGIGTGLIAQDLAAGVFRIFWQTAAQQVGEYWYKVQVTFSDGAIKTYLESQLILS